MRTFAVDDSTVILLAGALGDPLRCPDKHARRKPKGEKAILRFNVYSTYGVPPPPPPLPLLGVDMK